MALQQGAGRDVGLVLEAIRLDEWSPGPQPQHPRRRLRQIRVAVLAAGGAIVLPVAVLVADGVLGACACGAMLCGRGAFVVGWDDLRR